MGEGWDYKMKKSKNRGNRKAVLSILSGDNEENATKGAKKLKKT